MSYYKYLPSNNCKIVTVGENGYKIHLTKSKVEKRMKNANLS